MENKISIDIPVQVETSMQEALNQARALLAPYVIALTQEQRQTLPKMGDKTFAFVSRALVHAEASPNLNPGFLDVAEWKIDVKAHEQLFTLFRICEQLCREIEDTSMLCGSEGYTAALAFYNNVKLATKNNVVGAKAIYDDLSPRFPGRPSQAKTV